MNQTVITYISIYSIALWVNVIGCINSGYFSGDLKGVKVELDNGSLLLIAVINQLIIISSFFLFKFFTSRNITTGNFIFEINKNRFSKFMFFILIIHIAYFRVTDVGRVFGHATSPFSPLFSLIGPSGIFYFYYLYVRKNGGGLFFLNVALFSSLELMKGWSSFLLIMAFFELYFFVDKYKENKIIKTPFLFSIIIPVLFLVIGGGAYKYIYIFKNDVRGIVLQNNEITYSDALSRFSDRLSYFSASAGIYSKLDDVVSISKSEDDLAEIKGFFRPIVPKFIMENKDFKVISNTTMLAFFPDYPPNSGIDMGSLMYYWVLYETRPASAIFVGITSIACLIVLICFYRIISSNQKSIEFLIFLMIFSMLYTADLEVIFSGLYLKGLLFILFFLLFGILKIKKHNKISA
ncbi:TPA: oligosaccharide repeat unit polymerase [Yersinia enterocolitica]|uniref:oligosaccharide repeat unit polymerase n=1 Tax=Yersinia enterocolitica TaxID=630 RepID=UPI0021E81FE4|nr:oligosaccharide repeat unit polymerase [Yersinia enterocolitica]UYJ86265.1 oligosaccharide repeat unit polymerase [Yersinia enterocolitica]UYK16113.1 oligosaccharide repeat unit polymerase [Yersinia enterocolitica]HEN3469063.1 oligosaccharide repeat unit polymerase [Yersinia enterocolitica]